MSMLLCQMSAIGRYSDSGKWNPLYHGHAAEIRFNIVSLISFVNKATGCGLQITSFRSSVGAGIGPGANGAFCPTGDKATLYFTDLFWDVVRYKECRKICLFCMFSAASSDVWGTPHMDYLRRILDMFYVYSPLVTIHTAWFNNQ